MVVALSAFTNKPGKQINTEAHTLDGQLPLTQTLCTDSEKEPNEWEEKPICPARDTKSNTCIDKCG